MEIETTVKLIKTQEYRITWQRQNSIFSNPIYPTTINKTGYKISV